MDKSPLRPSQQSSVLGGGEEGGRQERGTKEEQGHGRAAPEQGDPEQGEKRGGMAAREVWCLRQCAHCH